MALKAMPWYAWRAAGPGRAKAPGRLTWEMKCFSPSFRPSQSCRSEPRSTSSAAAGCMGVEVSWLLFVTSLCAAARRALPVRAGEVPCSFRAGAPVQKLASLFLYIAQICGQAGGRGQSRGESYRGPIAARRPARACASAGGRTCGGRPLISAPPPSPWRPRMLASGYLMGNMVNLRQPQAPG